MLAMEILQKVRLSAVARTLQPQQNKILYHQNVMTSKIVIVIKYTLSSSYLCFNTRVDISLDTIIRKNTY